jgi:Na+-driven multidrug efflux pump
LEGIVTWFGHFLFLMVISHLATGEQGVANFAAHGIGVMVEAITYLPAVAWGMAAATMIGQSLGADNKDRAWRAGHEATLQCAILAGTIGLGFFFGAHLIYTTMHEDPLVHAVGVPAFKLLAFFEVPLVVSIVYVYSLKGAGDTVYPLLFSAIGVILVRVPTAYFFGIVMNGGLFGAWIGMGVDIGLRAVLIAVRYHRGRWLATRV